MRGPICEPDAPRPSPSASRRPRAAPASRTPVLPKSAARMTTTGMPLSMQVSSMPSTRRVALPVGQQRAAARSRHVEKIERDRRGRAGHAVDARVALVFHRAARRLHARHRECCRCSPCGCAPASRRPATGTSPFSIANGPDAGEDVAAVLAVADLGLVHHDLQEQIVDVGVGMRRRETTATLLVSGCAPPMPSIWRASGEPMAASSTRSRARDIGRQIAGVEIEALRRAAAHHRAGDGRSASTQSSASRYVRPFAASASRIL